ncbi:hypothetical protein [Paracidovorax oryzae]|uniref:hypothetical protein n=1 Tax=Paracidovorax oryzae TaxID=862720 RepID=UPI000374F403|nr:hypothetical protein [Paracidovorax oryzae]
MSAADDTGQAAFDETSWTHRCAELAARARGRSGGVWELYVRNLSEAIDEVLPTVPSAARQRAAEVAREFGYELRADIDARLRQPFNSTDFLPSRSSMLGCGSDDVNE